MPDPKEQFSDLLFPVNGIDLAAGFQRQRQGTTRAGVNVRAFEPLTERMRGGRRSGLSKYIAGQLPNGAHLIQNLNTVVDPQAVALLANFNFPPPVMADPSSAGPGPGNRIPAGQQIPIGGTGATPSNVVPMSPGTVMPSHIQFVQFKEANAGSPFTTAAFTFNTSVMMGDLLVVAIFQEKFLAAPPVPTLMDSLGTIYTQIGSTLTFVLTGVNGAFRVFYGVAPSSGSNTVTATQAGGGTPLLFSVRGAEYSGTQSSPLDSSGTNIQPATSAWSTGSVNVSQSGSLVLGCCQQDIQSGSLPAGETRRGDGFVDVIGASGPTTLTGTATSSTTLLTVVASFKPA